MFYIAVYAYALYTSDIKLFNTIHFKLQIKYMFFDYAQSTSHATVVISSSFDI